MMRSEEEGMGTGTGYGDAVGRVEGCLQIMHYLDLVGREREERKREQFQSLTTTTVEAGQAWMERWTTDLKPNYSCGNACERNPTIWRVKFSEEGVGVSGALGSTCKRAGARGTAGGLFHQSQLQLRISTFLLDCYRKSGLHIENLYCDLL